MLSPYGLDIIESCLTCKMRSDRIFCDLPTSALQSFEAIKYATAYPKGAVLFVEGQAPRGIFVLCKSSQLNPSRAVLVNAAGRITRAPDANDDGIPEDASGIDITTCTP